MFHPIIQKWFAGRFKGPTAPQIQGWPQIAAGEHTLIAAPTGSGKTLTAFLAAIDRLFRLAVAGELDEGIRVVYVSPLRALSNDMHRNLEEPLAEIMALALAEGLEIPTLSVGLRTGDTPASRRAALIRKPPHILVTTPESLYILLTSVKGRERLQKVETVIVDEIHALVRDKRGSHLALTLERLAVLCPKPPQRIGLSATQRPIERVAEFLVGFEPAPLEGAEAPVLVKPRVAIVDVGHQRDLDLEIEVPPSELGAVCMHEQWEEINQRVCELILSHRSTLVFVNARRMAERVTHQLSAILGEDAVSSHHGSLSAEKRLDTEQKLKTGQLKAVVATASLELGLDVGYVDLVIQLGSPRSIATFLQRVGRSGHALGLVPKGRLFALTRDELLECMALIRAIRAGRLDIVPIPVAPLDVLAQQIVAEVAGRECGSDELFELFRRAAPYHDLKRTDYDEVLQILSEGMTPTGGRSRVYLHHDRVGRRLKARPGARISATTNGGAIPEIASYRVVAEPEKTVVGSLDEEFATESQAGEVFLLGNTSWRIQYVRGGDVVVTDAQGAAPSIPFWRGEGPGRTLELSEEVSRLREDLEIQVSSPMPGLHDSRAPAATDLDDPANLLVRDATSAPEVVKWCMENCGVNEWAASQAVTYLAAQKAALGIVPTQKRVIFERFFDESGGMQMVIHAPFGARICRAWGLSMRKRFCRSFDFELQATADDDGIVLSLGPQHSFPLESMFSMLNAQNVQPLLEQALFQVPTFQTRWRWNVMRALLVLRFRNGKKVPPAMLRFRADDLLTAVFPKLTGCQENVVGDIELPDNPIARQSMHDSLTEPCDIEGLKIVMERISSGAIELIARDTREPSPFSYELLNANPYAFLDGGEAQERRTRAVATRRSLTVESVSDLGRLDPAAIEQVRREAQPLVRSPDELHDLLLSRLALPLDELAPEWLPWLESLAKDKRATLATSTAHVEHPLQAWVPAERLPAVQAAYGELKLTPRITAPEGVQTDWPPEEARLALIRGLVENSGPVTTDEIARRLSLPVHETQVCLEALEGEGLVLRGRFTPAPFVAEPTAADSVEPRKPHEAPMEWCHRRLLARIHRLTMEGLRKQIEPVTVDIFIRFLFQHHGLLEKHRRSGTNGLFEVISMLQGLDTPAVAWERDLLPARLDKYRPENLDELCLTGEIGWGRLFPIRRDPDKARPMAGVTRVVPMSLFVREDAGWLQGFAEPGDPATLSSPGQQVYRMLQAQGAMFAADIMNDTRLLPTQLYDILGELVTHGLVTADGFAGLRNLLAEKSAEQKNSQDRFRRQALRRRAPLAGSGRWSLWRRSGVAAIASGEEQQSKEDAKAEKQSLFEEWAWQLLRRWGVVFRDILEREDGAPRWFELLQVLRKLEARGEVRGGRFITGVAGEQFALGDTVKRLRQIRDDGPQKEVVIVSAADPLNLAGILTTHPRVPSTASNRLAYVDGVPVAAFIGGEVRYLVEPTAALVKLLDNGRLLRGEPERRKPDPEPANGNETKDPKRRKKPTEQRLLFPNQIPRPRW